MQMTDDLITGNASGLSMPRKSCPSQYIHTYKPYWLSWVVVFEALFECHDILIFGQNKKSGRLS